jgi:hypothetical protein
MRVFLGIPAVMLAVAFLAGPASVTASAAQARPGYRLLSGDGGVFSFGGARFFGSAASDPTKCPTNPPAHSLPQGSCVSSASTPDGDGYWILNRATGRLFPFGDAGSFGQPSDFHGGASPEFAPASLSIVPTPSGKGYWVLTSPLSGAGRVEYFGDATFFGDTQSITSRTHTSFNGSPVALATTRDGRGYWEVHSDGGVFAFADARFFGSMAGAHINQSIVGIAPTADAKGYWLVAADGGVFAFGDARFGGSLVGKKFAGTVVGIARNTAGPGYWVAVSDGAVYSFGGAPTLGSMAGTRLAQPVVAIASSGSPS